MCTKYTPFYMSKTEKNLNKFPGEKHSPSPHPSSQPSVTWYWKRVVKCQLHKDEHLTGLSIPILGPRLTKLGTLHVIQFLSYHEYSSPHFCAIVQQKSSPICVHFASLFTPNNYPEACLAKKNVGASAPPPKHPRAVGKVHPPRTPPMAPPIHQTWIRARPRVPPCPALCPPVAPPPGRKTLAPPMFTMAKIKDELGHYQAPIQF